MNSFHSYHHKQTCCAGPGVDKKRLTDCPELDAFTLSVCSGFLLRWIVCLLDIDLRQKIFIYVGPSFLRPSLSIFLNFLFHYIQLSVFSKLSCLPGVFVCIFTYDHFPFKLIDRIIATYLFAKVEWWWTLYFMDIHHRSYTAEIIYFLFIPTHEIEPFIVSFKWFFQCQLVIGNSLQSHRHEPKRGTGHKSPVTYDVGNTFI